MLLYITLPFFNYLFISLFSRLFGKIGTLYLLIYSLTLITFSNIKLLYIIITYKCTFYIPVGVWMNVSFLDIKWEFIFDVLAVSILVIVSIISTLVHLYSFAYIKTDPYFNRFISYLSLFTFFIFMLVTASNLVQLFVGWEGVGICSYLLINFWFTRIQANKSALKALLINRIGDIGFLIAIALIFYLFKSSDFTILQALLSIFAPTDMVLYVSSNYNFIIIDVICLFLLIGVVGKSAQIGLHTWLPAAIEGPTPVSALIHAATIVTAGVFLLIRTSFVFDYSCNISNLIIIFGAVTAFISAFTAIFLYDIKRIIAYSTCSQLGYIVLSCGLAQYTTGFFHLINHAFFKALLFLTAGAIIHSFNNEQDIRKLFNLFPRIPFIYAAILIGNIAIMGFPFLSGFYSKDLIIEFTYVNTSNLVNAYFVDYNIIFMIIMLATLCTAIYSMRLYYFVFLRTNVSKTNHLPLHQPFFIQFSLLFLIIGSIFGGYVLNDLFNPLNNLFNKNINSFFVLNQLFLENEYLPYFIKLSPFICNIIVVLVFYYYYYQNKVAITKILFRVANSDKNFSIENYLHNSFNNQFLTCIKIYQNNFYFNEVYNYFVTINFYYAYYYIFLNLDKGSLEYFGPTGSSSIYIKIVDLFSVFYRQNIIKQLFIIYNTLLVFFLIVELFI